MAARKRPKTGSKRILIVLFVPGVERDGATAIDQDRWVRESLRMLGELFGGATAYPKAKGVWRDDERGGVLVFDEPVVIHCYVTASAISDEVNVSALGEFCRRMGRETNQGEIGLIIDGEYFAFRELEE